MSEAYLSSDFEKEVMAAMAVPDASTQFVNDLRQQLVSQAEGAVVEKSPVFRGRLAWAVPLLILFILLTTTLVIGPEKVWAAVRNLFGYLPGVGYVQTDGSLLVLSETVQMEREGVEVSVEQVVADTERTVVVYKVEGVSVQAANSQGEDISGVLPEFLRLPDGTELALVGGGGSGWEIGYRFRVVYPALPDDVREITFVIPRIHNMPPGAAPEDWEIQLELEPSQGEVTLMPVYEPGSPGNEFEDMPETTTTDLDGDDEILFSLERVVEMDDGFLFEGTISWVGDEGTSLVFLNLIRVEDANGEKIPAERADPDELFDPHSGTQVGWALKTFGKTYPGPWKIILEDIGIESYTDISFQIDLGENPQIGDMWQVTQDFSYEDKHFTLNEITLEPGPREDYRLSFEFSGFENLYGVTIQDPDNQSMGSGGGGGVGSSDPKIITTAIHYDYLPSGVRQFNLGSLSYRMKGTWQQSWNLPASSEDVPPTETSNTACLTLDYWNELKSQNVTNLPDQITGKLLLLTHSGMLLPEISLVSLDGSQRQEYGIGSWVSLSPSGDMIAYSDEVGINIVDAHTGESTLIPGTTGGDYPIWSPDETWIAFHIWDEATIYRVRLDGSELTPVYQNNDIVYLSDWSPDGLSIIYLGFGENGMVVRGIDIESGNQTFSIQTGVVKPTSRPKISPDGEWVLVSDKVTGGPGKGVYTVQVNGSERKLLAWLNAEAVALGVGDWSPDGNWVLINVLEHTISNTNDTPVLINPDTCEVVPLFSLSGRGVGWGE